MAEQSVGGDDPQQPDPPEEAGAQRNSGMSLAAARSIYYKHSGNASSAARQLAFAGIAVVWIMATEAELLPEAEIASLRLPLFSFVTALALDVLQYYGAALLWGAFARREEKAGKAQFRAPKQINYLGNTCFWLKGAAVAIGYAFLFLALWPVMFR